MAIAKFTGTVPNPVKQQYQDFENNVQDILDWLAGLPEDIDATADKIQEIETNITELVDSAGKLINEAADYANTAIASATKAEAAAEAVTVFVDEFEARGVTIFELTHGVDVSSVVSMFCAGDFNHDAFLCDSYGNKLAEGITKYISAGYEVGSLSNPVAVLIKAGAEARLALSTDSLIAISTATISGQTAAVKNNHRIMQLNEKIRLGA